MRKNLLLLLALTLAVACRRTDVPATGTETAPTDSTAQLVLQIRRQSRLYTTEYQIHKIVTHTDDIRMKGRLFGSGFNVKLPVGDRKVAIPIDVTLKAYIDFSDFGEDDLERTDSSITVTLPDPHIVATASRIDHEGTRQYVDLARTRYTDEEMAALARQGADSIVRHAGRYGIVEAARNSAARLLLPLLARMGYDERHCTVRFGKEEFSPEEIRQLTSIDFQ